MICPLEQKDEPHLVVACEDPMIEIRENQTVKYILVTLLFSFLLNVSQHLEKAAFLSHLMFL